MRNEDKTWLLTDAKGTDSGPFTYAELQQQYAARQINGDTLCMPKTLFGASGWKPLSNYFPDFKGGADWPLKEVEPPASSSPADWEDSRAGSSDVAARSSMNRYRDAYLVARATTAIGGAVKAIGIVVGLLIAVAGLIIGSQAGTELSARFFVGGIFLGVVVAIPLYVLGILVAAHGQVLKATVDTAVHSSPFLTKEDMAKVMSL